MISKDQPPMDYCSWDLVFKWNVDPLQVQILRLAVLKERGSHCWLKFHVLLKACATKTRRDETFTQGHRANSNQIQCFLLLFFIGIHHLRSNTLHSHPKVERFSQERFWTPQSIHLPLSPSPQQKAKDATTTRIYLVAPCRLTARTQSQGELSIAFPVCC